MRGPNCGRPRVLLAPTYPQHIHCISTAGRAADCRAPTAACCAKWYQLSPSRPGSNGFRPGDWVTVSRAGVLDRSTGHTFPFRQGALRIPLNLSRQPPDPQMLGISGPSLSGSVTRRIYSAVVALLLTSRTSSHLIEHAAHASCGDRNRRTVRRAPPSFDSARERRPTRPTQKQRPPFQEAFEP
jgi:hypothetical protein